MPAPPSHPVPARLDIVDRGNGSCGHNWIGSTACASGSAHLCSRTSPDHRSHLCSCQAVELRTATHLPLGSSGPVAFPARRRAVVQSGVPIASVEPDRVSSENPL